MRPLQTPIFCQQVYLLATKVSFHPMAKVFSLCERILVLFQCGLVETQKVIFFYTSCHPYGSILAPKSSPIRQAMISMPTNIKSGLWYESIHLLEQVQYAPNCLEHQKCIKMDLKCLTTVLIGYSDWPPSRGLRSL